jgi:hypothetical protein
MNETQFYKVTSVECTLNASKTESGIKKLITSKEVERFKGCIAQDNIMFDHIRRNE